MEGSFVSSCWRFRIWSWNARCKGDKTLTLVQFSGVGYHNLLRLGWGFVGWCSGFAFLIRTNRFTSALTSYELFILASDMILGSDGNISVSLNLTFKWHRFSWFENVLFWKKNSDFCRFRFLIFVIHFFNRIYLYRSVRKMWASVLSAYLDVVLFEKNVVLLVVWTLEWLVL